MTITRRWQAGFESNGTDSRDDELTSYSSSDYVTISTEAARTGTYALSFDSTGGAYASQSVTRTAQGRIGFVFMMQNGSGNSNIVEFQDSQHSGDDTQFTLMLDKTSGHLKLYTNDAGITGDLQATGTATLSTYPHGYLETWPDGWYHIGVDFKLDNSAGWITVYVDGVQDINMTGDTIQSDMSGYVDALRIGDATWSTGVDIIYDDMYFDDTAGEGAAAVVPDRRFHYLRANANGSNNALTGSDGDSTNNYLLMDEMPHDSDTTYVGDTALVSTLRDSYGIGTVALDVGYSIAAVIPVTFARKGDTGSNTGGVMLRSGTAEWSGGTTTLTTSYAMMWDRKTTQIGSTAVWDQTTLDAVEAGVVSYP